MKTTTLDKNQIDHFSKDSANWWDPDGPFKPLHRLNPARMEFIRDQLVYHFGLDDSKIKTLSGLSILDIGCGGGLISEPLCRLGATVTGLDADAIGIAAAKEHADSEDLDINYICGAAEDLAAANKKYDIVLALEIIEHTASAQDFVALCASLVKKGGLVIFSTLNRTWKSYALGIVAAEHLLRWVPVGTHDWKRFVKPSELGDLADLAGLNVTDVKGLIFNPVKNEFSIHPRDVDVNYFLVAEKL